MPTLIGFSDQYTSVWTNRCLEKLKAASRKKGVAVLFLVLNLKRAELGNVVRTGKYTKDGRLACGTQS